MVIHPLRGSSIDIYPNARWKQNGITVAGGSGQGNGINQLSYPLGLYVDDDQTIYVADTSKHRIVEWKQGATSGQVVAGGNGQGSGDHQLNYPADVIIDKERDSLIICDTSNGRVVRWPRRNGTSGETIISNISSVGLTMDENGSLYVTDFGKHEVRRYRRGESQGTVVAGGNGRGNRLDQLSRPQYVFVDRDHSVYISDEGNHRVMKWMEGAKQGIVVAGGQGEGNDLTQLSYPEGVVVDQLGTIYVTEQGNDRIMRWPKGATQGSVIVGGNGSGGQSNQLNGPMEVENLVKEKDKSLSFVKPSCATSAHWNKYQQILVNNIRQKYIICNDCHSILTWTPSDGTNVMKKHSIACSKTKEPSPQTQPRITSSFKETSQVTHSQLHFFQQKILRGAVEMCVLDSRPFNITHGKGFEEFTKQIFDAGKHFGKMVDVKQLSPHRTTISRNIDHLYSLYHQQLRDLCKTISSFSITVDFWTEDFSGVSFAGVAIHYYQENKGLVSLILCCRAYDLTDATAPNVRLFVDNLLTEFNLKLTDKQYVITDNEPKMICAFKAKTIRVGCSCHYLSKVLEKSFIQNDLNCEMVRKLFDTIRPIVTHIIRSHKQAILTRRLQLYCKTRWSSIYSMFFTFNENFSDLPTLLDNNHRQSLDTIDQELLRQLIPFLKLFLDMTERLSNEQQPTLHLVLPCRQKLIQVAKTSSSNEHPDLAKFKNYFIRHIENDWPIQDEHFIATVLHPQFKQLEIFSKKIRRYAHDLVKSKIRNDLTMSSSSSTTTTSTNTPSSSSTITTSTNTPSSSTITTLTTTPSSINRSDQDDLLSSLYDTPKDTNKKKMNLKCI
ncbi:unnamed protein product [Rotaria sp. Silwood1]|nr:unnamed protein product [Rotaria sp. Silwood1]